LLWEFHASAVISLSFLSKKRTFTLNIFTLNRIRRISRRESFERIRILHDRCVHVARKEERRISCKRSHGTVAARSCRMFYEICGISRLPGKERTAFRTASSEITVYASETRINMGQYGCQMRNVILRYISRVSTPTPFNFCR